MISCFGGGTEPEVSNNVVVGDLEQTHVEVQGNQGLRNHSCRGSGNSVLWMLVLSLPASDVRLSCCSRPTPPFFCLRKSVWLITTLNTSEPHPNGAYGTDATHRTAPPIDSANALQRTAMTSHKKNALSILSIFVVCESELDKMAGCNTGFVNIDETWTQDKALQKYSSHKKWYTKYISKVQNLKNLNEGLRLIIVVWKS